MDKVKETEKEMLETLTYKDIVVKAKEFTKEYLKHE